MVLRKTNSVNSHSDVLSILKSFEKLFKLIKSFLTIATLSICEKHHNELWTEFTVLLDSVFQHIKAWEKVSSTTYVITFYLLKELILIIGYTWISIMVVEHRMDLLKSILFFIAFLENSICKVDISLLKSIKGSTWHRTTLIIKQH